jgi:hypothetical protein
MCCVFKSSSIKFQGWVWSVKRRIHNIKPLLHYCEHHLHAVHPVTVNEAVVIESWQFNNYIRIRENAVTKFELG